MLLRKILNKKITFLLILIASAVFPGMLQADDRPNVLFIIVDDLNDMPLHPSGKPYVPTPNFDRLAKQGVSFTNAHCNDPICAPSRSSCLLYTSPSPRDATLSRMPSSA